MANGIAPYLLLQLAAAFQGQFNAKKITTPGFLKMLMRQGTPNIISQSSADNGGNVREVRYWYRQRGKKGNSSTTDNCDLDAKPTRREATIAATQFRKVAFVFEDDVIGQYEAEAKQIIKPATNGQGTIMLLSDDNFQGMLREVYETIIEQAAGLIGDINADLLTQQSINFGVNATTASNAAVTVNFPLSTATNPLTSGMTKIISDARVNEFDMNNACIVGSGLIDSYMVQHLLGAKGLDQSGLNTGALQIAKNYFYDPDAANVWGSNQFGVFDANAAQLLEINRYVGHKAGIRGGDIFFNAALPMMDSMGELTKMNFDFQLRYKTCAGTETVGGESVSLGRGWNVIISKSFDLVNLPSDQYATGDRLEGNNGTLRYTATNA